MFFMLKILISHYEMYYYLTKIMSKILISNYEL